jgi:hypothetical protein
METNTFQKFVIQSACRETSAVPKYWSKNNPTSGHCAVVALFAQKIFGGNLLRADLKGTPFEYLKSHFWNIFPNGKEYDFTKLQFDGQELVLKGEGRKREDLLKNENTMYRYKLFTENFRKFTS